LCWLFPMATKIAACKKDDVENQKFPKENAALFEEAGSIDIGETGAAEITAFDPETKRVFCCK
jgi:hypothetical protein